MDSAEFSELALESPPCSLETTKTPPRIHCCQGWYICMCVPSSFQRGYSRIRGTSSSQLSHRPAAVGACGLAVLIPHLFTTVHHHTQASLYTSLTQRPSVLSQWGLSCSLRSDLYSLTAQADLPNLSFSL